MNDATPGRLDIAGEFTIFTAQALQARLLAALDGHDELDVDLSQVTDIDSAGLQLMIAAKRTAHARRKTLRFSGHSPAVIDLLDLCDVAGTLGDPVLIARP